MPNKSRYAVMIAVAGAHALVLGVLFTRSLTVSLSVPPGIRITALVVTRAARQRPAVARPRLNAARAPLAPVAQPITLAPPVVPVRMPPGSGVDWGIAAQQAAAAVLGRRQRISFGFPRGTSPLLEGAHATVPAHPAGETYRTQTGQVIAWTSSRCYLVSDPPVPGEPDVLARARITRANCVPPPQRDSGELFRSLPAYRRYHPREPRDGLRRPVRCRDGEPRCAKCRGKAAENGDADRPCGGDAEKPR